jgi:hypothetical protein
MMTIRPLLIGGVLAVVAVGASAQNRPAGPGNNPAALQAMNAVVATEIAQRPNSASVDIPVTAPAKVR